MKRRDFDSIGSFPSLQNLFCVGIYRGTERWEGRNKVKEADLNSKSVSTLEILILSKDCNTGLLFKENFPLLTGGSWIEFFVW